MFGIARRYPSPSRVAAAAATVLASSAAAASASAASVAPAAAATSDESCAAASCERRPHTPPAAAQMPSQASARAPQSGGHAARCLARRAMRAFVWRPARAAVVGCRASDRLW